MKAIENLMTTKQVAEQLGTSNEKEVFLPNLTKIPSEILNGIPDGFMCEELVTYTLNHKDEKNSILTHLVLSIENLLTTYRAIIYDKPFLDSKYKNCKYENYYNSENEESNDNFGFVYLARTNDKNDLFKIGKTNCLTQRERTLKTGNIYLEIFAHTKVKNPLYLEKFLHIFFKNKCVKNEWFLLDKNDLDFLINEFGFNYTLNYGD